MSRASSRPAMLQSQVTGLQRIHQGKVRDIYAVDAHHLLIVATDRLRAFDVVLPDPIPGKGVVLTQISHFWFERTAHLVPNHLTSYALSRAVQQPQELDVLAERSMVVKRLRALPIEAVVRGYLIGSGWRDYQQTGRVCGITLPSGMRQAQRLPHAIFTPSSKAELGAHDENISFERVAGLIGQGLAEQVRAKALELYAFAAEHALARGIIIADTKFEFGLDEAGHLTLMDEVLTPDSSRFWPVDTYREGTSPPSFDKQFVRDYLETLAWDKRAPGPHLPEAIIEKTSAKYAEALQRLTR